MSSVSRARRTTETGTGSGGKIVRRRRDATAGHPYLRPGSPPGSESPRWISSLLAPAARTIVTGAGKLLFSVFGSPTRDRGCSSSSDDDEDDNYSDNDNVYSKEDEKSNQNGTSPESNEELFLDTQPTAQKSESKRAIEQLLLKETFTRDECTELMKIVQSRVVDCPTMKEGMNATQEELHGRTFGNDITSPGAWRSLSQTRKSPEPYLYSMNGLSALSPGASSLQAHTPNLCNTAITEAKKWLEEKRLESSSNSKRDRGPFPVNTDVLPHVIKGDVASPVDLAKTYMRSRPPWVPLSLNDTEFKTPPPIGIHHYMDESSHSMARYSLPSTKELKRNYLSIGSWDIIEETRRVRLKSTDDILEQHALKQIDSSATVFDIEPDKGEVLGSTLDSSSLPAVISIDASSNLPGELTVDESCRNGVHPSDENAVEVILSVTTHVEDITNNLTSIKSIPESEETVSAEDPSHGISSATLPSETEHSGPEKNKDLDEAQTTKELVSIDSASHKPHVPDSISVQHDGAGYLSAEVLIPEPGVVPSERDECVLPSYADGVVNNSTYASSQQISSEAGKTIQAENSQQLHESPGSEKAYSLLGSTFQGEDQMQKEANGLGNSDDANDFLSSQTSLSVTLNTEPGLRPYDETVRNSTSSDHGELAADKHVENYELLSEVSMEAPATNETNTSDGLQNGTSKTVDEAPQIQPQKMSTRAGMRGKKVGYFRRNRGRGK